MKAKIFVLLIILLLGQSATAEVIRTFLVDPGACVEQLQWNAESTSAKCVVRRAEISANPNITRAQSINFSLPMVEGLPQILGSIRPLWNGYVFKIESEQPISRGKVKPLLIWALSVALDNGGIMVPQTLCERVLAEFRALQH
ncbi:MAG: hypothetical protein AB7N80_05970 [Bdellovibrionales bacterium]